MFRFLRECDGTILGLLVMRIDSNFLWCAMVAGLPSLGVAALGLMSLGWLMLTSPPVQAKARPNQIGVVIAPGAQGGLPVAAGCNLPIRDLRWGGHLVILDISEHPGAPQRLRDMGYLVINTAVPPSCLLKGDVGV